MPNKKISALPAVTTLIDTDILPAVASGVTSKITLANLRKAVGAGPFSITTAGSYLGLETAQATAPATPTAGFRLYADASHRLSWKGQNGFVRTFDGVANTANRTYTLPNASGTVGLLEVANTWTATQTIDRGTGTLPALLTASNNLRLSNSGSNSPDIETLAYGASSSGLNVRCRTSGGTRAAPSAISVATPFFNLLAYGADETGLITSARGRLQMFATETWSSGAHGTGFRIYGTSTGTTTETEWVRWHNGSQILGATSLIGSERMRVTGGSIAVPGSNDVVIGGGAMGVGATTASTSSTTGALTVAGDVGANALWAGTRITRGAGATSTFARVGDSRIQSMSAVVAGASIGLMTFSTTAAEAPIIALGHSPAAINTFGTATRSGDRLGGVSFQGVSSGGSLSEGALIIADADGAWGASAFNTRLRLMVNNGSTLIDHLTLNSDLSAGFAGDIKLGGTIKIKGNAAEISAQPASLVTGGQASNLSVGARRYDVNGQGLVAYIDFRGADGSGNQTTGAMDFYLRPNSAVGSEAAEKVAAWTAGNSVLGGTLAILQTTASTSTTTGALTVSGGVGVAGNLYCGATANCVGLVSTGVASLGSTSTAGHTLIGNTSHAIRTSTATTANQDDVLLVQARTTGTAAAGFGAAIRMQAYSSIGADRTQGSIVAEWVVATDASRTGRIRLLASDSTASREGLRIDATGSAALIGFLGATAVARQTLGAAATDAATTQTLANNIRTALINLGLGQT